MRRELDINRFDWTFYKQRILLCGTLPTNEYAYAEHSSGKFGANMT